MTVSSAAREAAKRRKEAASRARLTTGSEDLRTALLLQISEATRIKFPSTKYQADPVGFFRDVLGVDPWHKQVEIIEAVRDHKRVAVRSGHKVSKSHTAAGMALWFYCSFPDARAIMSSTTARQVDQILWRELRMMKARGGKCVECKEIDPDDRDIERPCPHSALIDGEIGDMARTGLKSEDFREIVGFTAREAEAVAGISGKNLLYIIDEASGVPQTIFEAIEGNRAGGARIVLFSNPTRTEGEHFEAFHDKKDFYHCITVSSEETPNVVEGRDVIPGLAGREWIEEKKLEWGEDSALYRVRVKGEHATNEDGKIFSIHTIETAERLWHEIETDDAVGRLFIGLDPAGESGSGDETVFALRRGLKVIDFFPFRGLNSEQHLVHTLSFVGAYKRAREKPVVVIDREGSIGAELYGLMSGFAERPDAPFVLVAVRASDRAAKNPLVYDRMRDDLAGNLEQWFRDGGAIPENTKLAAELHFLEWQQQQNGRFKVTPKKEVKKALGRSPDHYDALALSAWEPVHLREDFVPEPPPEEEPVRGGGLDPYAGSDYWRRR